MTRSLSEIHDDLHELRIKEAGLQMEHAMYRQCADNAAHWEQEQRRLIAMRSLDQVKRMEAAIERAIKGKQ